MSKEASPSSIDLEGWREENISVKGSLAWTRGGAAPLPRLIAANIKG